MAFNKPETFEEILEVIDELAGMIDPERRAPIAWSLTNQVKALRVLRKKEEIDKEAARLARLRLFGVVVKSEDIHGKD